MANFQSHIEEFQNIKVLFIQDLLDNSSKNNN